MSVYRIVLPALIGLRICRAVELFEIYPLQLLAVGEYIIVVVFIGHFVLCLRQNLKYRNGLFVVFSSSSELIISIAAFIAMPALRTR